MLYIRESWHGAAHPCGWQWQRGGCESRPCSPRLVFVVASAAAPSRRHFLPAPSRTPPPLHTADDKWSPDTPLAPRPANAQIILCRSRCTDKAGMGWPRDYPIDRRRRASMSASFILCSASRINDGWDGFIAPLGGNWWCSQLFSPVARFLRKIQWRC